MLRAQESGEKKKKVSKAHREQELCMHLMNVLLSPFEYRHQPWPLLKPLHEGPFFAVTSA